MGKAEKGLAGHFFPLAEKMRWSFSEWKDLASISASKLPASFLGANNFKEFDCLYTWEEVIHC